MAPMRYDRTIRLIGEEAFLRLRDAHVAVFGIGGVGSYAAEALARAGIGHLTFVDKDTVEESNLNRQLVALGSTIGRYKAEVMRERALLIDSSLDITAINLFYSAENADSFRLESYDCVIDAIDSVYSKLDLVERTAKAGVPVISVMGAGFKLDPTRFRLTDLSETKVCPLARVMRRELKKRGVEHVLAVWSDEEPVTKPGEDHVTASVSFVPSVAGMVAASAAVRICAGIPC